MIGAVAQFESQRKVRFGECSSEWQDFGFWVIAPCGFRVAVANHLPAVEYSDTLLAQKQAKPACLLTIKWRKRVRVERTGDRKPAARRF